MRNCTHFTSILDSKLFGHAGASGN